MQRNTFTQDAGDEAGRVMRREAARRPLQASAPLIPVPLSRPAIHCGTVDATSDRPRPTARTVCQAFGPYASAAYIEPMRDPVPPKRIHAGATVVAIAAGVMVVCMLIAEHYAS